MNVFLYGKEITKVKTVSPINDMALLPLTAVQMSLETRHLQVVLGVVHSVLGQEQVPRKLDP